MTVTYRNAVHKVVILLNSYPDDRKQSRMRFGPPGQPDFD
jgi:hypothetical protein